MHSAVFPTLYLLNGEYDDCLATREMAAVLASNRVQENLPKIAKQSSYYVTIKSSDAICIVILFTGESYLYLSNVAYRPRSARLYCRALLRWFTVHVPKPRMVRVVVVSLLERRSQMKYFISQIDTYSNVNLKGVALQKFLKVFAHKLLLTDEDRAAFLNWINDKVEQLDEEYPRSKQLRVSKTLCNGDLSLLVLFHPDSDPDKIIARFYIHKVKGECKHLNISSNEKGGYK